jgi:hypothetical protein
MSFPGYAFCKLSRFWFLGEGFLVDLAGGRKRREGLLADVGRGKRGFSQIVADQGADSRRFLIEAECGG